MFSTWESNANTESNNDDDWSILMGAPNEDDQEAPSSSRKRSSTEPQQASDTHTSKKKKNTSTIREDINDCPGVSELPAVANVTPSNNLFYIIALAGKKGPSKHYVAQADTSKNQGDFFWMDFFKKTDTPGEFCQLSSKKCLVSSEEVVVELSSPTDVLMSSSRAGKLLFNVEELRPFLSTLQ